MTNRFSICLILSTLTISIAIAYATTTFLFKTTTNLLANAFAQETAEERAHEENENVQNGFSPVNPELTKQAINRSQNTGGGINLSPKSLIQSGAPLLGNPSAPVTIVEFGVLMGIVVSMNVYILKHSWSLKIKINLGSFFSGSTLSMISSTCASCSSIGFLLVSTFGRIGVTASMFLSNYQTPLRVMSIALLVWALYSASNKLTQSCVLNHSVDNVSKS